MTQTEWENCTEEERMAEWERCKDTHYYYLNYWLDSNGNHPKPISKEQWDIIMSYFKHPTNRFKRGRS